LFRHRLKHQGLTPNPASSGYKALALALDAVAGLGLLRAAENADCEGFALMIFNQQVMGKQEQ
jgi:hypothetical protein